MIQRRGFVDGLREAGSREELLEVVADADAAIDSYLSDVDTAGEASPVDVNADDSLGPPGG
jgi:hypothetical protein